MFIITLSVANMSGCWHKDVEQRPSLEESKTVVQCMRQLPVSVFINTSGGYSVTHVFFVPSVDGDFIPDAPENLLKNDIYLDSVGFFNKSFLAGINNNEAASLELFMKMTKSALFMNNDTFSEENELMWKRLLTQSKHTNLESRLGFKGSKDQRVLDAIDDYYVRRYADNLTALVELSIDLAFLIPAFDFLMATSRRPYCNSYLMYFDYFPSFMKGPRGMLHGVESMFIFDAIPAKIDSVILAGMKGNFSKTDLHVKALFSSVLGNFVRTGNPGLGLKNGWPRFDSENSYYLNFNPRPWVSNFLRRDRQDFWLRDVPELLTKQKATNS